MPPVVVSAVPIDLLDLAERTAPGDDAARRAGIAVGDALAAVGFGAGLAGAVVGHVRRARAVAEEAGAIGGAMLLAGGATGALALVLRGGPPVDADAAALLLAGAFGLSLEPSIAVPQPDVDPVAVASLAAALGADVLAEVAARHPQLVGPVDGMPVELRYAANRRIAELAGLDDLASPDHQLLLLDPLGDRVVEVLGDLRSATAVAVVVPGMSNDLEEFDIVRGKAAALRAAAQALDPPEDLVTIAWLGYDSPEIPEVLLDDSAHAGGVDLARFVAGLAPSGLAPDATRTLVGHSYGSVVVGHALRSGADVDAVAVTGSPGMDVDRAEDLGPTPVYALATDDDLIPRFEHFGTDPTDPDFGATVLDTGRARGHAEYFEPCGEVVANLALVATGRADEAARAGTSASSRVVEAVEDIDDAIPDPVDVAQEAARIGSSIASDVTDAVGGLLPEGAADALDRVQHDVGDAYELTDRLVDDVQRVLSPSFLLETVL